MIFSRPARILLRLIMLLGLLIMYIPLLVLVINSFNSSQVFAWPPTGLTLIWWQRAFESTGVRGALLSSLIVGLGATLVALVLGSLLAVAVGRYRFFGRQAVSFLVILPIALPGVVTGLALNAVFTAGHIPFGYLTVIIGHATICIVVVFNNVLAGLRRAGPGLEEASMDLGANRWQTFGLTSVPQLRSALVAGALLAFALSFDEIAVTTFTASPGRPTLPIWMLGNLLHPSQAPVVNVVATALIVVSIIPVWASQRLCASESGGRLILPHPRDQARRTTRVV